MSDVNARVMIFEEKHDSLFFLVKSKEDKSLVALRVLRDRASTGYYYPTRDSLVKSLAVEKSRLLDRFSGMDSIDDPDMSFAGLPPELTKSLMDKLNEYNKELSYLEESYEDQFKFVDELDRLLSESDEDVALGLTVKGFNGRLENLAWWLLECRSEHQYEGYEIERLLTY